MEIKILIYILIVISILTVPVSVAMTTTPPGETTQSPRVEPRASTVVYVHLPASMGVNSNEPLVKYCNMVKIIITYDLLSNDSIKIDIKGNVTRDLTSTAICLRNALVELPSYKTEEVLPSPNSTQPSYYPMSTTTTSMRGARQLATPRVTSVGGSAYSSNSVRIILVLLAGLLAGALAYAISSRW